MPVGLCASGDATSMGERSGTGMNVAQTVNRFADFIYLFIYVFYLLFIYLYTYSYYLFIYFHLPRRRGPDPRIIGQQYQNKMDELNALINGTKTVTTAVVIHPEKCQQSFPRQQQLSSPAQTCFLANP